MHGEALRGGAGPASLPPGAFIPLAAFGGVQSIPLPLAGVAAAQSLMCGRSTGRMLPPPLLVIPGWPHTPALLLAEPGVAMLPASGRGRARRSTARHASVNPTKVQDQS